MGKKAVIVLIAATIVLSVAGTLLVTRHHQSGAASKAKDYPLLSQKIFAENSSDILINFSKLRQDLKSYFSKNHLSGSLYFEYLPTGTSIRINDNELNVAASLIKLPVAMELYKDVELGKVSLDKTLTLKQDWLDDESGTLYQKGAGYQLTLGEANEIMLTQSDNTALRAIVNTIDGMAPASESPFNFLDTEAVQNQDMTVSISSKSYSSFLKCLYFSCYLKPQHSQEILNLLTQSEFNDRLTADLDDDVTVAHKIGNYFDKVQSDCGIVYVPNRNYVLCVMLDGPETQTTDSYIAKMSRMAYDFVKTTKTK